MCFLTNSWLAQSLIWAFSLQLQSSAFNQNEVTLWVLLSVTLVAYLNCYSDSIAKQRAPYLNRPFSFIQQATCKRELQSWHGVSFGWRQQADAFLELSFHSSGGRGKEKVTLKSVELQIWECTIELHIFMVTYTGLCCFKCISLSPSH